MKALLPATHYESTICESLVAAEVVETLPIYINCYKPYGYLGAIIFGYPSNTPTVALRSEVPLYRLKITFKQLPKYEGMQA